MEISCKFVPYSLTCELKFYTCVITDETIPEDKKLIFNGDHIDMKTNNDITQVFFENCKITKIPSKMVECFPKLKKIFINSSNLKKICRSDLKEYKNLEAIAISECELEFLPGDLFSNFNNLEWISMFKNKLSVIEPNLLDGHKNLKYVDLSCNPNYNVAISIYPCHNKKHSLNDIKDVLFNKFIALDSQYMLNYLKKNNYSNQKGIFCDLKACIKDENLKDFKIKVNNTEFHVHKFLLAARSPTLAALFRHNPESVDMNLIDISEKIFKTILNYFYTDEFPDDIDVNYLQLYAAAGRLKVDELMSFAAEKLKSNLNKENAIDVLKVSNKYENNELIENSMKLIRESYPEIEFKDELASNPDKIITIIVEYKKMEEEIKIIKENFKKLIT